ncbi:MAG TPA: MFS transporter [Bacillota bacterium]|nr:MFS transporter [Bacillota bacterium]HOL09549.1 MFS transporter [Bacillota bacterium]HPO97480.1 MFS transporter [Bacillota bacterium]
MKTIEKCKVRLLSRFPALKHQNFRCFLAGQSLSLIGTWMQRAAQQWVVYQLTKSPLILGLVGVCQFTPMLLFSLFAGVLVDRFPKKQFLIVTQSLQMLQAFILAGLLWTGRIEYWHILILAGFLGLTNTFDMPTRQSFFIELVGREDLVSAIGLNSTIVNGARILGPALAGLFLSTFGAIACFLFNGFSFIAVLIGLFFIQSYTVTIRAKEQNVFADIVDGLKYLFSKRILADTVVIFLIMGITAMNSDILIPVFAQETFDLEAGGYSLMLSAMGIGSLLGSLWFAGRKETGFRGGHLYYKALMLAVFLIVTGTMRSYYLALVGLAGIGLCNMIFMATVNSTIQLNTSDTYRGRAVSVYTMIMNGMTPIGNLGTSLINQNYGPENSFLICGLLSLLSVLILLLLRRKTAKLTESSVNGLS